MLFGRLFDSRRKPKAHTDGLSTSPASPLSSSGTATPVVPNKLRRNKTVSVSTNVAKETHANVRKHLSIAVPRANKTTPLTIILPTPRARAASVAAPKSPTPTPSSIDVSSSRPRSTFEGRRAEHAALTQTDGDLHPLPSPSSLADRSARTSATALSGTESSPLASSSSSAVSAAPTQASSAPSVPASASLAGPSRPLLRRGSSAPPSVAGVVRAELDADGLHIRDAHAHRPEPVLVVPREQVAEFCGVVGVWEEEEEGRDGASDDDARTVVFTAEPESMLPSEGEAAASVSMHIALPTGTLLPPSRAALARLPATAPSTPNRSQNARYYFARRRTQSLISPSHRYHRTDLRRKISALATKRVQHPLTTGSTASIRRRSRTRSSTTRRHALAIVRSSSTRSTRSARDVPS